MKDGLGRRRLPCECFIWALFYSCIHYTYNHRVNIALPGARVDTGQEEQRATEDKESYEHESNELCDHREFFFFFGQVEVTDTQPITGPNIPHPPVPGVSGEITDTPFCIKKLLTH